MESEALNVQSDLPQDVNGLPPELANLASTIDLAAQEILLASSRHDVATLRALLREYTSGTSSAAANVTDGETGYTPLHAAISGMADTDLERDHAVNGEANDPANRLGNGVDARVALAPQETHGGDDDELSRAEKTVKLLLQNGAVWNTLDVQDETPGCLAWRMGQNQLYELLVDAGVRAEILFQRLDGYEEIVEVDEDDDDGDADAQGTEMPVEGGRGAQNASAETEQANRAADVEAQDEDIPANAGNGNGNRSHVQGQDHDRDAATNRTTDIAEGDATGDNSHFLSRKLTFSSARLLDDQSNAVMMEWERTIMSRTVDQLFADATPRNDESFTVLNIGHGMGIFDSLIQTHPKRPKSLHHHIIEAHPDVIAKTRAPGGFLASHPEATLHEGRWQDVVPKFPEKGLEFDVIYFDTYAEPYSSFRNFFEELVIGMLKEGGRWSFFHGLGADRRVCYDVYTKVVEMDLFEAGFDVAWEKVPVDERLLKEAGVGVSRKYWDLEEYRLPVVTFLG
ncbi:MAG: hypothetical protein Q9159_003636 [Coniocarpon cinnabarinum]